MPTESQQPSSQSSNSSESSSSPAEHWHLVAVTPWGREVFCTELGILLERSSVSTTGILKVEPCVGDDFANYVLLQVENFALARNVIRQMNHFQSVERRPLKPADVSKMLGL
jgi:hypothetical protein